MELIYPKARRRDAVMADEKVRLLPRFRLNSRLWVAADITLNVVMPRKPSALLSLVNPAAKDSMARIVDSSGTRQRAANTIVASVRASLSLSDERIARNVLTSIQIPIRPFNADAARNKIELAVVENAL